MGKGVREALNRQGAKGGHVPGRRLFRSRVCFDGEQNHPTQHAIMFWSVARHFKFEMIFTCCSSWGARAWRGIGSTKIGRRQGKAESKNKTRKVRCCSCKYLMDFKSFGLPVSLDHNRMASRSTQREPSQTPPSPRPPSPPSNLLSTTKSAASKVWQRVVKYKSLGATEAFHEKMCLHPKTHNYARSSRIEPIWRSNSQQYEKLQLQLAEPIKQALAGAQRWIFLVWI